MYKEFFEIAANPAFVGSESITNIVFDVVEESIWAATSNGTISQLTSPDLERYSSFPAHTGPVFDLLSIGSGIVSLSENRICIHTSGGIPCVDYYDSVGDLASCFLDPRGTRLLIGRSGGGLFIYDMNTGQAGVSLGQENICPVLLRGPLSHGTLVAGTKDGYIHFLDAGNSYKSCSKKPLLAHPAGFQSIAVSQDTVVTAGYTYRRQSPVLEQTVKVFDVRMTPRMLATLPFAPGPAFLSFHPMLSSALLIGSAEGVFSFADLQALTPGIMQHVDTEGDALLTGAFSLTGEMMAFGGSGGYVHLWATNDQASVAGMQVIPEPAEPPQPPMVGLTLQDSFVNAPMFYSMDGSFASDYDPRAVMSVGKPPRKPDSRLLETGKLSDFVVYVPNPHHEEAEGIPGVASAAVAHLRNTRVSIKGEAARAERAERRAAAGGIVLPDKYKKVTVQKVQQRYIDEFDFSQYNKTPFVGLENDLANCYCNPLLQVLFFMPLMKEVVLAHAPDTEAEFSLTDELSFLFRMLGTPNAGVCQAANFLRALRQSKEAMALGLLEGVRGEKGATDIEIETSKERSLGRRIQTLNRFLVEQLNKEASASGPPGLRSMIEILFGTVLRQKTECLTQCVPPQLKETKVFQVELQYPSTKERALLPDLAVRPTFSDVLQSSLLTCAELRGWFNDAVGYQPLRQARCPETLPQVLIISCGLQDRGDLAWWSPYTEFVDAAQGVDRQMLSKPWLPQELAIRKDPESWQVNVLSECNLLNGSAEEYELTAVIAHVRDEDEIEGLGSEYEGHLLAHIKVPLGYDASAGERESCQKPEGWHLFNDFAITSCTADEVDELFGGQKAPSLLFYSKKRMLQSVQSKTVPPPVPVLSPLEFLSLCRSPPIQGPKVRLHRPTFAPVNLQELPVSIVALDAEFVQYSPPEKTVIRGMEVVLRSARLGLARVSAIRGSGPARGVPLIDDYIRSVEPVHDYLTKYSGLLPGDLDPTRSPHHLTTFKKAYAKLRYLVDSGCVFVGHGLKQDFRMLNIVVPQEQIIDTLDLFYLPRQRKLSLRFLTSHLLRTVIQQGVHDSIEDARAALALHEVYLKLASQGKVESTLKELYEWGKMHGWEPVVWVNGVAYSQQAV